MVFRHIRLTSSHTAYRRRIGHCSACPWSAHRPGPVAATCDQQSLAVPLLSATTYQLAGSPSFLPPLATGRFSSRSGGRLGAWLPQNSISHTTQAVTVHYCTLFLTILQRCIAAALARLGSSTIATRCWLSPSTDWRAGGRSVPSCAISHA